VEDTVHTRRLHIASLPGIVSLVGLAVAVVAVVAGLGSLILSSEGLDAITGNTEATCSS
jgi:hypothetical protein